MARIRHLAVFAIIALSALLIPALSATITCAACTIGASCPCNVTSCDNGTLVISDSSGSLIGAFPVSNGRVSWYPPKEDAFSLQANCAGALTNTLPVSPVRSTSGNCSCTGYRNVGCGQYPCTAGEMLQQRSCLPTGCDADYYCAASPLCTSQLQQPTQLCGNGICDSGENYLNCCADCQGCEKSSCSPTSRACFEAFDLVVDVPSTIYKGSQFLLSPREVINRTSGRPVTAYTLCWQAYCTGALVEQIGCNKNVFTISSSSNCVDTLRALLSVGGSLYSYDYKVSYLKQLKIATGIFPSQYVLPSQPPAEANFSMSIQNLDSSSLRLVVSSTDSRVRVNGSSSREFSVDVNATAYVRITTPAEIGEYSVTIADAFGKGESIVQKLPVVAQGTIAGAAARITMENPVISVSPGSRAAFTFSIENAGLSDGSFTLYSKGAAASAISFGVASPLSIAAGAKQPIPATAAPPFTTPGDYSFYLCAAGASGEEVCFPATLRIAQPSGGMFDLSLSSARVELGIKSEPATVGISVYARSTLSSRLGVIVENSCPAGLVAGPILNATSVSVPSGGYSSSLTISPQGQSSSCAVAITLSDSTGSKTGRLEISVTPSASDVSAIADIASRAQTKIAEAESQIRRIAAEGKDASSAEAAVADAKTALSACMQELNRRNYDTAELTCKNALAQAEGALAVVKYTEEAYGIAAPGGGVNIYIVSGIVVVLVGAAVLTFGRLF